MGYVSRWMYLSDTLDALVLDKVAGVKEAKRDLNSALSDKSVKARAKVLFHKKEASRHSFPKVQKLGVDWFYYQLRDEVWTDDMLIVRHESSEAFAFDVEVKRMDVIRVFYAGLSDWNPGSVEGPLAIQGGEGQPKRGRKQKYNWREFTARAIKWMRENEGAELKAELEKFMALWCMETWGEDSEPAPSMIRDYCSPVWEGFRSTDN